jgi:hypothetical protein
MTSNSFGICLLAVVPLRAKPLHMSEMISQLIFGDTFEIIEQQESWIKIKTTNDDYEAWVDEKQIAHIDQIIVKKLSLETQFLTKNPATLILKGKQNFSIKIFLKICKILNNKLLLKIKKYLNKKIK